jgi:hypothetical protein
VAAYRRLVQHRRDRRRLCRWRGRKTGIRHREAAAAPVTCTPAGVFTNNAGLKH